MRCPICLRVVFVGQDKILSHGLSYGDTQCPGTNMPAEPPKPADEGLAVSRHMVLRVVVRATDPASSGNASWQANLADAPQAAVGLGVSPVAACANLREHLIEKLKGLLPS